jgi:hypothetical protein
MSNVKLIKTEDRLPDKIIRITPAADAPEAQNKETVVFDWYIRTDEIGDDIAGFCRRFDVEQVKFREGWTIIRCETQEQRQAVQTLHHKRLG